MPLNPMSTFDPDMPCRVHDALNDKAIDPATGERLTRWSPSGNCGRDEPGRLN
jgi:hypothetical protein